MQSFLVMPCLNEERGLAAACASLGFGRGYQAAPPYTHLVLVDNGSEDRTRAMMQHIQQQSPANSVILASETERGYVPPRHRGILVASELAARGHYPRDQVLIIQADADTDYQGGYISAMLSAAQHAGPNVLVEGIVRTSADFARAHPGYQSLSTRVSDTLRGLRVNEADDVIVDDKVCAFGLKDYFVWGGHVREFDPTGQEIHAETSRLFMKAKVNGARKVRASGAIAHPSRRKIFENPVLHFATNGFPRAPRWAADWARSYNGPNSLDTFERSDAKAVLEAAILTRQAHELIMFGVLPAWIAKKLGSHVIGDEVNAALMPLLSMLPCLSADDIRQRPGKFLHEALLLIESHSEALTHYLAEKAVPL
jgi:glycosyltransferase involved in cell wall biosynthesis